ncbi:MAG: type II toxin-antitoxin system RelE/ParE family toxin [Ignavibacteriales bacterium]|nr:type II toxin-antitoxin system RelE/ParE family toxin [Ignavibacteriales bacterium]
MVFYKVNFKSSAERELRKLPSRVIQEIGNLIDQLNIDPFPEGTQKLSGKENIYRAKVDNYRVIYSIDSKNRQITIYRIRHRKDAYRKF